MDDLIKCYHELLKLEHRKLEENNFKFNFKSRLNRDEVDSICKKFNINFDTLIEKKLLIPYSSNTFRTMHYDLIFRAVNVRAFLFGSKLPLEYAIYQFEEYLPDFNEINVDEIKLIDDEIKEALKNIGIRSLSRFQYTYISKFLIDNKKYETYVISSPTGSGKSLIFMIPVLSAAMKRNSSFLIYPRKALASDQLSKLLNIVWEMNEILRSKKKFPITIGIDDGDTPKNSKKAVGVFRGVKCPLCKRNGVESYLKYSRKSDEEVVVECEKGHIFDFIIPTKEQIWKTPPTILITNSQTINRRLMDPSTQRLFAQRIAYIVFDESHVYREEIGGHLHHLIRRIRKKIKLNTNSSPKIILSSATLPKQTILNFASELTGIDKNKICWLDYNNFLSSKRKRIIIHLVLLPNPFTSAEVLSENILLLFLVWSTLRNKKSLFFVDSVHEVYRLYHFVNVILTREVERGLTRVLEHFKKDLGIEDPYYYGHFSNEEISEKSRELVAKFQNSFAYHHGGIERSKRYHIEEEFKKGIKKCLVTTSTLELGIDIGDISLIGQFRYPFSGESYIQRVGRAGRSEKSLNTVLSVLVLSNSPSQIRYVYSENSKSLFQLPPNYTIPIPLMNEIIKQQHTFFEILDTLAQNGKRTFINSKDIREEWKNADYQKVIESVKRLLKDGKIFSDTDEKRYLLDSFLERIRKREQILKIISSQYEEEIIPTVEFRIKKLDPLEELLTEIEDVNKKLIRVPNLPISVKEFFENVINYIKKILERFEYASAHFKNGNVDPFESECKKIEKFSKELTTYILSNSNEIEKTLWDFGHTLISLNADEEDRKIVSTAIEKIQYLRESFKDKKLEISYTDLINYFYDVILEINHFLRDQTRWYQFDITKALNILGVRTSFSLLFDKPLPKIYLNYLGLPKQEEYLERTIDKLLWIATPFRVTPLEHKNEKYFFTTVYGLNPKNYKVTLEDFTPLEGGDVFSFEIGGQKFIAKTPHFINMINLNDSIVKAISSKVYFKKGKKIVRPQSYIVLSNKKDKYQRHDIDKLRMCMYGFFISTEQRDVCKLTERECPLFRKCGGKKYFIKPRSEFERVSYLSVVKVFPNFYVDVKEPKELIKEFIPFSPSKTVVIKTFQGAIFTKAISGCSLISTGKFTNFLYPPSFMLNHETLGYRISSNGIYVQFDNNWLEDVIKDLLRIDKKIKAWISTKFLIAKKYFPEVGDIKLDLCQKAFKGLYSDEGTKRFRDELKKLIESKDIPDYLLKFAKYVFLHSFSHVFYEYLIEKLKTSRDNLAYYIDLDNSKVFIIENAERGLGLTQTLIKMIKESGEEKFFLEIIDTVMRTLSLCEINENKFKESVKNELSQRLDKLSEEEKRKFYEIKEYIETITSKVKKNYGISIPVEILRNLLVEKFGDLPFIADIILSSVSYCWDGCYNDVRLERGCIFDPFRQMVRVSKCLLEAVFERLISLYKIKIHTGKGFEWILKEIEKTESVLRISSPWVSPEIVKNYLLPLMSRDVKIEVITRNDPSNLRHQKAVEMMKEWSQKYENFNLYLVEDLHAKMIIIDRKVGFEGSLNLTWKGLHENVELVREYREINSIERLIQEFNSIKSLRKQI